MSSGKTNRFVTDLQKGVHDLTSATVKMLLLDTSYVFDPDADFVSSITSHELSGPGYSRQTLASKAVTQDNTNDRARFSSSDVVFTGINAGSIGMVAFMRDRGGADSANEFLVALDNVDLTTNGGDVTVHCPASPSGWWYF